MIKSIHLKNFQCHVDRTIEFDPGINIIVGESRKGKSAIFRAMLFALLNESKKTNIVNWDAKFAEVTVDINGSTIVRTKGTTRNEYKIDDLLLKAFGVDVPEEIKKITKIDEINVERQHDPYFLISETAGNLGKYFNELVGLDCIDEAFVKSTTIQSDTTSKLKAKKEQLDELAVKRDELLYLEDCSAAFDRVLSAAKELDGITIAEKEIALYCAGMAKYEAEFDYDTEDLFFRHNMLRQAAEKLNQGVDAYREFEQLITRFPETVELGNIEEIIARAKENKELRKKVMAIDDLVTDEEERAETDYELEQELIYKIKDLQKISPTCPTCGGKWKCL
jgi:DNA repair exonuclease SbcCD ATPase subunit